MNNYGSCRPKAFACAAFRVNFRCGNRALCVSSAKPVGLANFLEKVTGFLFRRSYAAIQRTGALKVAPGCGYLCEQGCSFGQACTKEKLARADRRPIAQRKRPLESMAWRIMLAYIFVGACKPLILFSYRLFVHKCSLTALPASARTLRAAELMYLVDEYGHRLGRCKL